MYFYGFAEYRLWECRISSVKNAGASQKSCVLPLTFHFFLLLEALQSFVRLLEVLEVFGSPWDGLECFGRFCRLCEVLRGLGRPREVLEALDSFVLLWLWKALGSF